MFNIHYLTLLMFINYNGVINLTELGSKVRIGWQSLFQGWHYHPVWFHLVVKCSCFLLPPLSRLTLFIIVPGFSVRDILSNQELKTKSFLRVHNAADNSSFVISSHSLSALKQHMVALDTWLPMILPHNKRYVYKDSDTFYSGELSF